MKVFFVYKIFPCFVFYTSKVKRGFAGSTKFFFVKIRCNKKNDIGLLHHELTHCKQFWRLPIIHSLLYLFSKRYRKWAEIEAYKEQLKWPPACNDKLRYVALYAHFIATKYNLKLNTEEENRIIKKLLTYE